MRSRPRWRRTARGPACCARRSKAKRIYRAIEIDGDEPEVLRWRADAHTHSGDHRAALADLDRALVLEPESGEAFYLRYACRGELGDAVGAQEDLLRARELWWPDAMEDDLPEALV